MQPAARTSAGRQAAWLLVAAGLLTVLNNFLPGKELLHVGVLNAVGGTAVGLGLLAWVVPWDRWPHSASLVLAFLAFAMISLANGYGGVSAFSYAVYFVVVFVWVGMAHPPRTSFLLAPFATVAYLTPQLLAEHPPANAVSSVTVAIPVCMLVGETLARAVRRQLDAQLALTERARLVEGLARAVAEVATDLDLQTVLDRTCRAAAELVDAPGTAFVIAREGTATIAAVHGLSAPFVGQSWAVEDGSVGEVLRTRRPLVHRNLEQWPHLVDELRTDIPGLHTLVVIPSVSRGEVHGALYALIAEPGREVSTTEVGVLQLLASHAGTALANARTHTEVLERVRALEAAKDVFLATTSHELRTPLTVLKGFATTLQHRWHQMSDPTRRESIDAIAVRTDALVDLVDHILLGTTVASRGAVPSRPVDVGTAIHDVVRDFAPLALRHTFRTKVAHDLPLAAGDQSAVHTALAQLVENAMKYSPDGGEIVVSARADPTSVIIDVADSGIGLTAGDEERIFDRFFQAEPVDRRAFGGVGLGLHIVRQLVESQGGTVHAAARETGGTLVGFSLRRVDAIPDPRPSAADRQMAP